MIKKKILILVDYLRYFRRERYKCSSLDLETITTIFKNHRLNFEIRSFQEIIEASQKPEDLADVIFLLTYFIKTILKIFFSI